MYLSSLLFPVRLLSCLVRNFYWDLLNFGILKTSPHVMYGSTVWFLGLLRGIWLHKYYRGALQYTMLIFGLSSLCSLRWNIYKDATIFTMYSPIYYDYIFLLIQHHAQIHKYTLICIASLLISICFSLLLIYLV